VTTAERFDAARPRLLRLAEAARSAAGRASKRSAVVTRRPSRRRAAASARPRCGTHRRGPARRLAQAGAVDPQRPGQRSHGRHDPGDGGHGRVQALAAHDGGERGVGFGPRGRVGVGDVVRPGRGGQGGGHRGAGVVEPHRGDVRARRAQAGRHPAAGLRELRLRLVAVGRHEQAEAQDRGVAERLGRALGVQAGGGGAGRLDRRVLVEPAVAAVGVEQDDRLLHEALRARLPRRLRDRPRGLAAQPVGLPPRPREGHPLDRRDARQQVHHRVGAGERRAQRPPGEDVRADGLGAERRDALAALAHDAPDLVPGRDQLAHRPAADRAGRPRHHHVHAHARVTTRPRDP
jgi:hypothetical protein